MAPSSVSITKSRYLINFCFCFCNRGEFMCALILWFSLFMLALTFALFLFPSTTQLTKGSSPLLFTFFISQNLCVSVCFQHCPFKSCMLVSFFPVVSVLFHLTCLKNLRWTWSFWWWFLYNFRLFSYFPSLFSPQVFSISLAHHEIL